ncbi:MAG: MurR/RpiR family transcriptional regulator [Clostridia bacterium]|nr:MurR/RpiR family transcriptional regulator [Clostridia bacterium]
MDQGNEVKMNCSDLELLLLRIRGKYPFLTDASKRIADYILEKHSKAVYLNISELARECGVSESTITKFIKTIGYNSFHELKICLARTPALAHSPDVIYGEISLEDNIESICTNVFFNSIEALRDSFKVLDTQSMDKAASLLLAARKIDLYGLGSSNVAALNARMRLYRLGIMCFTYNDSHEQAVSASLLDERDVAIGISNSGKSSDVVRALEIAKQSGASTICITNHEDSPITRCADIKLFTSSKDSDELNENLHARIAEAVLLDALYVCVASKMKKLALSNLRKTSQVLKYYKL